MIVLGIDTSCDDTAIAVVRDGCEIMSNVVSSQDEIHESFGGVVPEVASRRHLEMIKPVFETACARAAVKLEDCDAIGVTYGPGLLGSLLVGLSFARSLAWASGVPLIPVNHHSAHLHSTFLQPHPAAERETGHRFPFLGLLVSGGHTMLIAYESHDACRLLGATRDDACGEVFDKIARLLELGYPGGPRIEQAAREADAEAAVFPRPMLGKGLDFSFSGLKTAVVRYVLEQQRAGTAVSVPSVAAGLQQAVVEVLVAKTLAAVEKTGFNTVVVSGGVAANGALRSAMEAAFAGRDMKVLFPGRPLCTDNGAMVAALASILLEHGNVPGNAFDIEADPGARLPGMTDVQAR